MEIRKSWGRFISIFLIVALGVAFYAGIRASEPSMRISGDAYFDKEHLMDIKVMGTMGLTEEDVEAIEDVDGIELAEGTYSMDALCNTGDTEQVVHVMAMQEHFNDVQVSEGRLPEKEGECLMDEEFALASGYGVGDTITLKEKYEKEKYSFKIAGVYGYTAALCVFMPRSELNDIFDLGEDYYSGYFSDTELTDIKSQYIGSVVDLDALTKISRQLDVSMGSMMGMVNGFAIMIYMVLIYLLSKIIIEKNAQSISMVKILGYTNGEISKLYIMSTSLVVVFCLLLSLPLETVIMKVLFREMMLSSISGWITLWIDPMIYVQMFAAGIITYGIVALLEFRRVKKVPMDEALKNVE